MVNAAGVVEDSLLIRARPESLERMVKTNLLGAIYQTQEAAKVMIRDNCNKNNKYSGNITIMDESSICSSSSSIIHIGSIVGLDGHVGQAGYSATKSALVGLIKTAAMELARYKIR